MSNLAYQSDFYEKRKEELLDGKLVMMSPQPALNHMGIVGNIHNIFKNFLKGKPCSAFTDGVDVYLTKKDRVVPDVMIVCNRDILRHNGVHGVPDLIVEVLSPGTASRDKGYKKDLYERCGVKEYWIVTVESRSVEIYILKDGRYVLDNVYTKLPDYELEDMTEEEKSQVIYEFTTSLFPEMTVVLEDVFDKLI